MPRGAEYHLDQQPVMERQILQVRKERGVLKGEMKAEEVSIWEKSYIAAIKGMSTEGISGKTVSQYSKNAARFFKWAHQQGCTEIGQAREFVQSWIDRYENAYTARAYGAAVSKVLEMSSEELTYKRRGTGSEIKKGRTMVDVERMRNDQKPEYSPRYYLFADAVPIRRNELARLRGNDLVRDESGAWCVRVWDGKGGKFQNQRIEPDKVEFVRSYFEGKTGNDYVFAKEECKNKINVHARRSVVARRVYDELSNRLDKKLEKRLYNEIIARIKTDNARDKREYIRKHPKDPNGYGFKPHRLKHPQGRDLKDYLLNSPIILRGSGRERAIQDGRPISLNRLIVTYISVFHLSHYSNDSTLKHYM